jgi:hypothetical protein
MTLSTATTRKLERFPLLHLRALRLIGIINGKSLLKCHLHRPIVILVSSLVINDSRAALKMFTLVLDLSSSDDFLKRASPEQGRATLLMKTGDVLKRPRRC